MITNENGYISEIQIGLFILLVLSMIGIGGLIHWLVVLL